jgi:hypothetical protein
VQDIGSLLQSRQRFVVEEALSIVPRRHPTMGKMLLIDGRLAARRDAADIGDANCTHSLEDRWHQTRNSSRFAT